eukprot:TRINITY_DN67156_c0_g1_i1.p1 TRINITY_DN67156_c0_g1~~TRINITY_DN67156_c0_g1_i1.p1  ORF type:complete len:538 (+),score=183.92 TRINITY_DN67156_c0_g1_i1:53-1666(+)
MDIEELGNLGEISSSDKPNNEVGRHIPTQKPSEEVNQNIPESINIWVKTYGCSHNVSDGEFMKGLLHDAGYRLLADDDKEKAQLWLLNSCTVKDPSQAAVMNACKKGQETGKAVVVSGCVSQAEPSLDGLKDVSICGVKQIDRIVEVVEQTLQGHVVKLLSARRKLPSLKLPKIRKNNLVEIVPLSTGCLGKCTYCKTRFARGKLVSYPIEDIVGRVKEACENGAKEIWLTSEDTGAYGRDIGVRVDEMLRQVVDTIAEFGPDRMLRIGMTNPPYILDCIEEIAAIMRHPNVFCFLHIPVQSGSNHVLEVMQREYSREEFERCCDVLIQKVPNMMIATDIICGFPGEDNDDHEDTMSLLRKYSLPIVNISQFYPRPGTPAHKMKQQPNGVKKARSREVSEFFNSIDPYAKLEGEIFKVWVSEEEDSTGNYLVAHNKSYVKVLIPKDDSLIGTCFYVRVLETARFHVTAELMPEDYVPPKEEDNTLMLWISAGVLFIVWLVLISMKVGNNQLLGEGPYATSHLESIIAADSVMETAIE